MQTSDDQGLKAPEQLNDMETLDPTALDRLGGTDTPEGVELVSELIILFRDGGAETIDVMQRHVGAREWPTVGMAAHSLKSSAAYLGATRLSNLAAQLELDCAARQRDDAALTALVAQVVATYQRVLPALAALEAELAGR